MSRKIKITESQYKLIMNESWYNPNKVYRKDYIDFMFRNAPRELKRIVNNLQPFNCGDNLGECVTIPEVLFTYIKGRY